jgi:hypothetical protein
MAAHRSSSKNIRKMNLQTIFNKNSPQAHMESKFDILGVDGKLVKNGVHLSKKKLKKIPFSSHSVLNFWS